MDALLDELEARWMSRAAGSLDAHAETAAHMPRGVATDLHVHWPFLPVVDRACGAQITDVDGNVYHDFHLGFGVALAGHGHPLIVEAAARAARNGLQHGLPVAGLDVYAQHLCARLGCERVRLCVSASEAVMIALRLARAVTGRTQVIKAVGGYHGHADPVLFHLGGATGSGAQGLAAEGPLAVSFNDADGLRALLRQHHPAAVITEGVLCNAGTILPTSDWLAALDDARAAGVLVILDETKTGAAVHPAGAGARFGIDADLVIGGKALGGGVPVGVLGGERRHMIHIDRVAQHGTFAGSALQVACGTAMLDGVLLPEVYDTFDDLGERLQERCAPALDALDMHAVVAGAKVGLHAGPEPLLSAEVWHARTDTRRAQALWAHLALDGVLLSPGADEQLTLSVAHGPEEIDALAAALHRFAARVVS